MSGDKVVYLVEPINHGGEEITELKIRKPRGKDFKKLPIDIKLCGDILDWAARLAEVPPSVFDLLSAEDVMQVMEVVGDFLPNALATGGG